VRIGSSNNTATTSVEAIATRDGVSQENRRRVRVVASVTGSW
jgi:hypothetical protein